MRTLAIVSMLAALANAPLPARAEWPRSSDCAEAGRTWTEGANGMANVSRTLQGDPLDLYVGFQRIGAAVDSATLRHFEVAAEKAARAVAELATSMHAVATEVRACRPMR